MCVYMGPLGTEPPREPEVDHAPKKDRKVVFRSQQTWVLVGHNAALLL